MFSIKFLLDKEIRRIDTGEKNAISFNELKTTCERLFQGKIANYTLKYFDGEDWITCSSDEELHHAFQLTSNLENRILKFRIIQNNKRNILDSLEEALKTFIAKNPAKSLWELIKKEEAERKARKAKSQETKIPSSPVVESLKEPEISQENTESSSTSPSVENSQIEIESQLETITSQESEFPSEIQSESDFSERVDEPSEYILESVSTLENSEISQTDSITLLPQESIPQPPVQQEENIEEEQEEEPSQTKSVPDLSQSQLDPEKLALKLQQLEEMGFSNRDKNITCLIKFNGDMMEAVKNLLEDV